MADKKPDAESAGVAARRDERLKEYGQWVATEPIFYDGARAFNEGDPVPAANVRRHGYDKTGQVRPVKES